MSKGNKTRWPGWSSEQFLRHRARSEVWEAPLGHGLGAEEDSGLGLALALPSGAPSTKGEAGPKTDWDAGQSEDCDGRTGRAGRGEGGGAAQKRNLDAEPGEERRSRTAAQRDREHGVRACAEDSRAP